MEELGNVAAEAAVNSAVNQLENLGFFERIFALYNDFVGVFPEQYQWVISLIIVLALAAWLWKMIRKNIVWLALIIILFPGILPIMKNIFDSLTVLFTGK